MRFDLRATERLGENPDKPHELVITTYESQDGKTKHSSVYPVSEAEIEQLSRVLIIHLLNESP